MMVQLVAICEQQDKKKAKLNIFLKFTFMFSILNELMQYLLRIEGLDFAVVSLVLQGSRAAQAFVP